MNKSRKIILVVILVLLPLVSMIWANQEAAKYDELSLKIQDLEKELRICKKEQ
ncbi:MAG: hypothetical protein ACI83W_000297 [Marinoscillum sp.]|jgi:hypothetical protein